MSRLEDIAISTKRNQLLHGTAETLRAAWRECVKGGNEHVVFEDMFARDVIAYSLLRYIDLRGGYVYGGFVRSHLSGKPWNDLDIVLSNKNASDETTSIAQGMVRFLSFVLDLSPFDVDAVTTLKASPETYGTTTVTITVMRDKTAVVVKVDISSWDQRLRPTLYPPATLGTCLCLRNGSVEFCANHLLPQVHVRLCDIVVLLQKGIDVEHASGSQSPIYGRFFWDRIDRSKAHGWTLRPSLRLTPPRP